MGADATEVTGKNVHITVELAENSTNILLHIGKPSGTIMAHLDLQSASDLADILNRHCEVARKVEDLRNDGYTGCTVKGDLVT